VASSLQQLDVTDLQHRVQDVYRPVTEPPHQSYRFEMGRELALRLGYPAELLDQLPAEVVESFAGVGYFLDLATPRPGDLGSGSGTDSFATAFLVGPPGEVTGVDMTAAQLALSADKAAVFAEATRVLAPGGRLAIADIVSTLPLAVLITCNAELWATCMGGAAQIVDYLSSIETAGLRIETTPQNSAYAFLSARRAAPPKPMASKASRCSRSCPNPPTATINLNRQARARSRRARHQGCPQQR